jgi:organic radical activating enzyme
MLYSINEIFYSLQGEGRNTGMPTWFIRFAGCNLKCPFCDTDYSPKANLDCENILNQMKNQCKNVVLTGGEPTLQKLKELLIKLKQNNFYIAIETNGTNPLLLYRGQGLLDWITVSPKSIDVKTDIIVDEVKLLYPVITSNLKRIRENIKAKYYYLQPLDNINREHNIKDCVQAVKNNPNWRLSLQTQKILEIK